MFWVGYVVVDEVVCICKGDVVVDGVVDEGGNNEEVNFFWYDGVFECFVYWWL